MPNQSKANRLGLVVLILLCFVTESSQKHEWDERGYIIFCLCMGKLYFKFMFWVILGVVNIMRLCLKKRNVECQMAFYYLMDFIPSNYYVHQLKC